MRFLCVVGPLVLSIMGAGCRSAGSHASRVDRDGGSARWTHLLPETSSPAQTPTAKPSGLAGLRRNQSSNSSARETSVSSAAETDTDIMTTSARVERPVDSATPDDAPPRLTAQVSAEAQLSAEARRIELPDVVQSIYASYPLLQIAIYGRNVAAGELLSAEGAWDLKLKADANHAPLGFYQTNRNGVGFEQPTMWGGEVFGGYKLGRGNFEPWYGNRETNDGGEFGAGLRIPLAQNRAIDERRATLWKAAYGVGAVEPFIQAQIIEFIRAGSYAYWGWVAAGLNLRISQQLLDIAQQRDAQIQGQVKAGARPEALLIDNRRLIVSREVKLIEAQLKLQSAAIKLSLFLRTPDGQPVIPNEDQLPAGFPPASAVATDKVLLDVAEALTRRPELTELDFQHRMAQVDWRQAQNLTQPELDATLWSAKDVGAAANAKGDKTPFQAEAGLTFSVPLQRRKALGKIAAVEGKLVQIAIKRQFAQNKITIEVQNTVVTIDAAYRSIDKARESVQLNEQMQQFEVVKLDKGDSDLLFLNLREAATFDARVVEMEALRHYFESQADYRAALALDVAEFHFLGEPVAPAQPLVPAPQPGPVLLPAP